MVSAEPQYILLLLYFADASQTAHVGAATSLDWRCRLQHALFSSVGTYAINAFLKLLC